MLFSILHKFFQFCNTSSFLLFNLSRLSRDKIINDKRLLSISRHRRNSILIMANIDDNKRQISHAESSATASDDSVTGGNRHVPANDKTRKVDFPVGRERRASSKRSGNKESIQRHSSQSAPPLVLNSYASQSFVDRWTSNEVLDQFVWWNTGNVRAQNFYSLDHLWCNDYYQYVTDFANTQPYFRLNYNHFHRNAHLAPRNLQIKEHELSSDDSRSSTVPTRVWQKEDMHAERSKSDFTFTVMSYNILAQDLIVQHPYLYQYHDQKTLSWEVRWKNLLKEIRFLNPDILCLQEVQESHLKEYFKVLEDELGYKGIYKQRTGNRCDGCALYYKSTNLTLLGHSSVEFFHQNVDILNRDNVAIVAKLAFKKNPSKQIVVATTHLLYNPKRQDVKLAQTQLLITEIDKMAFQNFGKDGKPIYMPTIVTGDLNVTPDSAIYEFITKGVLRYENLTRRALEKTDSKEATGKMLIPPWLNMTDHCQYVDLVKKRYDIKDEAVADGKNRREGEDDRVKIREEREMLLPISSGILSHEFALKSVYTHRCPAGHECTTYQNKWITVDYIFYSGKRIEGRVEEDTLKLISKFQLPMASQLERCKIPNERLGSDHLCLLAEFKLE